MACYDTSPYTCTYDSGGAGSLPGGGSPDYSSLGTWESASDNDLAGYSGPVILDCYDSVEHSVTFVPSGATNTSDSVYRELRSASGCATPFAGKMDTGAKFVISGAYSYVFSIQEDYFRVRNICIDAQINSSSTSYCIGVISHSNIKVINCVFTGNNVYSGKNIPGIFVQYSENILIYNCIAYDLDSTGFYGVNLSGDSFYFVNCTAIGNAGYGFQSGSTSGTGVAWNCYAADNTLGDFIETGWDSPSGWNASKDNTSDLGGTAGDNYKNGLDLVTSGDLDADHLATADDLYASGGAGDNYGRNPYDDLSGTIDFGDFLKNDAAGEAISRLDIRGTARPNGTSADSSWNVGASQAAAAVPEISTAAATDVGTTTATLNGELTDIGDEAAVDVYFEWREVGAGSWEETSPQELTEASIFDEDLTGLDVDTDYEFRAVVSYGGVPTLAYGSTLSFSTSGGGSEAEGGLFFCHG